MLFLLLPAGAIGGLIAAVLRFAQHGARHLTRAPTVFVPTVGVPAVGTQPAANHDVHPSIPAVHWWILVGVALVVLVVAALAVVRSRRAAPGSV